VCVWKEDKEKEEEESKTDLRRREHGTVLKGPKGKDGGMNRWTSAANNRKGPRAYNRAKNEGVAKVVRWTGKSREKQPKIGGRFWAT